MKGSRYIDQQTGGQTATSASMKKEHTAIDLYGQAGVDGLYCVHHYMHNKHEGIQTYWSTDWNWWQTTTSARMKREHTVKDSYMDKQVDRL